MVRRGCMRMGMGGGTGRRGEKVGMRYPED